MWSTCRAELRWSPVRPSGLGLAMSNRFAQAGMKVVLADVEADRLDTVVGELRAARHDATGVVTDVADANAVNHLATVAFDAHGAVHVLCNNAGVVKRARVWELTLDDWNWVLSVDFWSVVHGLRAFVPRMLEQAEGGHIVNTSSMAGLLPMPNLGAYAAAKSAVLALSLSLQTEFDQLGILAGSVRTPPGVHCHGHHEQRAQSSRGPGPRGAASGRPAHHRRGGRDADSGRSCRAGS